MTAVRDLRYVRDIAEFVRRAEIVAQGGQEAFRASFILQDAAIRGLEVMGQAAKSLSPAFRQTHADLPWREMGRFRDLAIHRYFDVDLDIVWKILTESIPLLKGQLPALVAAAEQAADQASGSPDGEATTHKMPS